MIGFRENIAGGRYEFEAEGGVSFADYRDGAHGRAITHVETPAQIQGKGLAARLMAEIVADARTRGLTLRALCPYAAVYLKRHPDAGDVLA